mmetsp:Transcript_10816/g.23768  ORF Transcript_10816/g.23768 Transcript_10816/m.23768 type:complete len:201 (+) Transcript_10816:1433-2035(+)
MHVHRRLGDAVFAIHLVPEAEGSAISLHQDRGRGRHVSGGHARCLWRVLVGIVAAQRKVGRNEIVGPRQLQILVRRRLLPQLHQLLLDPLLSIGTSVPFFGLPLCLPRLRPHAVLPSLLLLRQRPIDHRHDGVFRRQQREVVREGLGVVGPRGRRPRQQILGLVVEHPLGHRLGQGGGGSRFGEHEVEVEDGLQFVVEGG